MAVDFGRSNPLGRHRPKLHDDNDGANARADDECDDERTNRALKMKTMVTAPRFMVHMLLLKKFRLPPNRN